MSTSLPGVSVALCCHNSAARLPPTLAHLAAQRVPAEIPWEVLVVDNASTDDTAAAAVRLWPAGAPARLRVVAEPQPGLQHARERAFDASCYPVISFIDDDNWVAPDWVRLVAEIMAERPRVAALGGFSEAEFESPPPAWFATHAHCFAVGAQGFPAAEQAGSRPCLWGAGLNVRREAWDRLRRDGFRPTLTDRLGSRLSSGGDSEMCHALQLAGWELWYDPRLKLRHYLPTGRLQWSYLRRLMRGFGATLTDPYWHVLDERVRALPAWRRSWLMVFLRELRAARDWLPGWFRGLGGAGRGEGDPRVLRAEYAAGRITRLLSVLGEFGTRCRAVREAPWRRSGN